MTQARSSLSDRSSSVLSIQSLGGERSITREIQTFWKLTPCAQEQFLGFGTSSQSSFFILKYQVNCGVGIVLICSPAIFAGSEKESAPFYLPRTLRQWNKHFGHYRYPTFNRRNKEVTPQLVASQNIKGLGNLCWVWPQRTFHKTQRVFLQLAFASDLSLWWQLNLELRVLYKFKAQASPDPARRSLCRSTERVAQAEVTLPGAKGQHRSAPHCKDTKPQREASDLRRVTSPLSFSVLYSRGSAAFHTVNQTDDKNNSWLSPERPSWAEQQHLICITLCWDVQTINNVPLVRNQQRSKQQNRRWNNYRQNHREAGVILIFISTWKSKEFSS